MGRQGQVLEVGLGCASLWGAWQTDWRLADEVDVRALVVRSSDVTAALLVADVSCFWPATCLRLRDRVAAALGVPDEHVGIFATQNHGTPLDDQGVFDPMKLDTAFVQAARQAVERLQPAQVAQVAVHPDPPLNFCRRVPLAGMGKFTFWNGFHLDEAGRPDCSHLMKRALARLAEGRPYQYRMPDGPGSRPGEEDSSPESPLPVPEPLPLPPADDDLLQGLFFRTPDGRPIGSLLRFAAHPDTANVPGADWHSGDYPVYARQRSEEVFGGMALFMTGPCGDQTSRRTGKSLELAENLGRGVADVALGALDGATWQAGGRVAAASPIVELRVRDDYPESQESAERALADLEARMQKAAGQRRPIAELKRLSDRWERQIYVAWRMHRQWTGVDFAGRAGQAVSHPVFGLRVGPAVIAGLPGEPFGVYSRRLRDETLGDALIVAEEGNGYLSYVCSAADYDTGGYGANAMIFAPGAEDVLVRAVGRAVAGL